MQIRSTDRFARSTSLSDVATLVRSAMNGSYWEGGALEQVEAHLTSTQEVISRFAEVLIAKGVLSIDDLKVICGDDSLEVVP